MRTKPIPFVESPCPVAGLDGPCRLCTLADNGHGYCQICVNTPGIPPGKVHIQVHRYAYEQQHGPIPDGLVIDHLCRQPRCFNPSHLRAVTQTVNALENSDSITALNKVKTHCKRGHQFTPANTRSTRGGRGRSCRACDAAYKAAYKVPSSKAG